MSRINSLNWNDGVERTNNRGEPMDLPRETAGPAEETKAELVNERQNDGKLHLTDADIGKTFYAKTECRGSLQQSYTIWRFEDEKVWLTNGNYFLRHEMEAFFQRENPIQAAEISTKPTSKMRSIDDIVADQAKMLAMPVVDWKLIGEFQHIRQHNAVLMHAWHREDGYGVIEFDHSKSFRVISLKETHCWYYAEITHLAVFEPPEGPKC